MMLQLGDHIPAKVAECLGYYVYLYVNPFDNSVFYVGKGHGNRALSHLNDESESRKAQMIRRIRDLGGEPRIDILIHGLADESAALRIEAAVIDLLLDCGTLTNQVRGWGSRTVGRMELTQLIAFYDAEPVQIDVSAILIRINQLYRYGMDALDLYEATRGIWKVNPNRHHPEYAFAVYKGIVREVYRINKWQRAGTTPYQTRSNMKDPNRWEFVGQVADNVIRQYYIGKSVVAYLRANSQNPVRYVNCDQK